MKKMIIAFIALCTLSVAAFAEVNTKVCAGCHGAHFEKSAMNKSKIVAEMSKEDVSKALVGYKNGSYGGSMKNIMKMQVSKYSEEELRNTGIGKVSFTEKVKAAAKKTVEKTKAVTAKAKTKVVGYFKNKKSPLKVIVFYGNITGYTQNNVCWVVDFKNKKSNIVDCKRLDSAAELKAKSMLPPTEVETPNPLVGLLE